MSLPILGEDMKNETSQKLPQEAKGKPQTEPKQQTAVFTREQMIKEAERIRREYERSRKAQRQGAAVMESQKTHKQETPLPELDAIETRVREMAQEIGVSSVDAQRDERVLLLVTATLKMCQLLKNYSTAISAEIQRLSEHQMQNLSLQEMYAKTVENVTNMNVYRFIDHIHKRGIIAILHRYPSENILPHRNGKTVIIQLRHTPCRMGYAIVIRRR